MIEGFDSLDKKEFETLKSSISLITILIAGADGKIDKEEKKWAEKITEIRAYTLPSDLVHFYKEVGEDFHEKLEELIEELPDDTKSRNKIISEKLAAVNPILQKLDNELAVEVYRSLKSFAKHVAKSSGGFLGMMSISKEEKAWIDLPMINEIDYDSED